SPSPTAAYPRTPRAPRELSKSPLPTTPRQSPPPRPGPRRKATRRPPRGLSAWGGGQMTPRPSAWLVAAARRPSPIRSPSINVHYRLSDATRLTKIIYRTSARVLGDSIVVDNEKSAGRQLGIEVG